MCWARKKIIIKGCFQRIPAAKHRTAANVIPARCRGGEGKKKIHPDDVRKAFQGSRSELLHQVFHFRIQHYILGKSPVCCLRLQACHRQFNTLTRSLFPTSSCEVHLCVRVCLLWCSMLSWVSIRFHFLFCSCALAPCLPSARFVFVCPPSEWEQLSLSASSRVYMTVAFSRGLFFFFFCGDV